MEKGCLSLIQTTETLESDAAQLVRDQQTIQSNIQSSDGEKWLADVDMASVTNDNFSDE